MSYILVQNKGELPLWGMRLLGASNKDESKIGRFGTGLKESIALCLRFGEAPIIFAGTCRIDFEVQKKGGQDEICFRLSETKDDFEAGQWYGLGIHPKFGHHDWQDPWMIFREVFCNAYDQSGLEYLHHSVGDNTPEGVPGATRIYIPASFDMLDGYSDSRDRLLFLPNKREIRCETPHGRILSKHKSKDVEIFHRQVWVQSRENHPSVFNYEINDLKLTESRNADWNDVNQEAARILAAGSTEVLIELLTKLSGTSGHLMRQQDGVDFYESDLNYLRCYVYTNEKNWQTAFREVFGNAVITTNESYILSKLQQKKIPHVATDNSVLYNALKAAGIKTPDEVLSKTDQKFQDVGEARPAVNNIFNQVWNYFVALGLTQGKTRPAVKEFTEAPSGTITMGYYLDGVCYINKDYVGSDKEWVIHAEEISHYLSGYTDETRDFQTFLATVIATAVRMNTSATAS